MNYRYGLAITSQFYFCSLPVRLDAYNRCQLGCLYCFASNRGGAYAPGALLGYSAKTLERRLNRIAVEESPVSALDWFLAARQPLHFGGMSEPFPPLDVRRQSGLDLLKVLAAWKYPVVVSTKSTLIAEPDYRVVLKEGHFAVQISSALMTDEEESAVEGGVRPLRERMAAASELSGLGVPVSLRLQPVLPGRERRIPRVVELAAAAGIRHFAIEFLKVPLERTIRIDLLSRIVGFDLAKFYRQVGATRVGREWILPVKYRLPHVVRARKLIHDYGMTFGAADTDLLPLSDGDICCSGVDIFANMQSRFTFNYLQAVRNAKGKTFGISELLSGWAPPGSIAQYVNSRSRIQPAGLSGTMGDYLVRNWSGRHNGPSPLSFFGVLKLGSDRDGFASYGLSSELIDLLGLRRSAAERI